MTSIETTDKPASSLPIDSIIIGQRHRRDFGDIDGLAVDIANIDLLHPIVVRPAGNGRYELACGARRLAAAKLNGQTHIEATVREFTDAEMVRAESSENKYRKDFAPSEAVRMKRTLEASEKTAAKDRQREGGRAGGKASGNLPQASSGRAADRAAKETGWSRRTLEKAEAIVDAAEAEPEKFGKLKEDMDRTGRVNGVYKRLNVARQAALIRAEPPPPPNRGPYRVGVVDFPWPYETRQDDPSHRAARPYPTMSIEQICATRTWLPALMHPDSILWLWCTNFHLIRYAAPVLDALGFTEKTILTWVKSNFGTGDLLRSQTEHCVMAVRGSPRVTLTNESTVLFAPARGHSAKPPEFYDLVERLCPAPRYVDLFSRYRHNDKWDCHGDEAPPHPLDIPPCLRRAAP